MFLFPRNPKYTKSFSNKKIIGASKKKNKLKFAKIVLIANEARFIPNFQIEIIRVNLRRLLKKRAKIFYRIFPNQPITKKPNEIRLGKGKGNFKYWSYYIKKNKFLVEINGQNVKIIIRALNLIRYKLGINSYIYNHSFRWIL